MKRIIPVLSIGIAALIFPFVCRAQVDTQDLDSDSDGLSDRLETGTYYTDPNIADTDGDGFSDGQEVEKGYSPLAKDKKMNEIDTDNDYLNDDWEIKLGSDLKNADTDGDKYLDGTEVAAGYDPTNAGTVKLEKNIEVQVNKYRLKYYMGGKMLEDIPISGGKASTPTPLGDFTILDKVPVKHYGGATFDYPNTKWNLHFTTNKYRYYIHGAYWHNQFGKAGVSGGCVNVAYENMERLYGWAQVGTKVHITKD